MCEREREGGGGAKVEIERLIVREIVREIEREKTR